MSNYRVTENSDIYREAIEAVENIEPSAIGFVKPDPPGSTATNLSKIIKQNNLLIQLLVKTSESARDTKEELDEVKQSLAALLSRERDAKALDEVVRKLENLKVEGSEKPIIEKAITPFYVFEDHPHTTSDNPLYL